MSKKNSSVNLKKCIEDYSESTFTYLNFKSNLKSYNQKSYVVAVSGGPDSLALAALTKMYSKEEKKRFFYVLVDHNIRQNSKTEAIKVKKLLKKHHIDLIILTNKKKVDKNIQSNARDIRYAKLVNFCKKKKTKILLTAHHLEDQVETFLIRLSRGSGLKGLSSMKRITKLNSKVLLLRPLLDIKKKSLIKISKCSFGKYIKDPSNKDKKFLRTKIRNLEKPLKRSGIKYDQIYKSITNLASSEAVLEKYFQEISKELVKKRQGTIEVNFNRFNKLDDEIKIRLINQFIKTLRNNYYNVRSKKVINLIANLKIKKSCKSTLGGCLFLRKNDHLLVKIEKK